MISRREHARARYAPLLRGRGLEIGALTTPFPVPPGTEVLYSDVLTAEQIAAMYPGGRVPDIHSDSESFPTIAGNSLDFVIANHVLEHVTSPIDALREWQRILRDGGILMMALPDKRYTFDAPRERTMLTHLIEDWQSDSDPRERNYAHLLEWAKHVEKLREGSPEWQRFIDDSLANGYAVHNHVWIARDVLDLLQWLGGWSVVAFRNTSLFTNEMIFVLRKTPGSLRAARMRAWMAEPLQLAKATLKRLAKKLRQR